MAIEFKDLAEAPIKSHWKWFFSGVILMVIIGAGLFSWLHFAGFSLKHNSSYLDREIVTASYFSKDYVKDNYVEKYKITLDWVPGYKYDKDIKAARIEGQEDERKKFFKNNSEFEVVYEGENIKISEGKSIRLLEGKLNIGLVSIYPECANLIVNNEIQYLSQAISCVGKIGIIPFKVTLNEINEKSKEVDISILIGK